MADSGTSTTAATQLVFAHHQGAFAEGLDALMSDYDRDSVLITPEAEYRGLAAIRGFFQAFLAQAKPAFWETFRVQLQWVDGPVAYLVWHARPSIALAADTLYVRNGKIAVQTFTPLSS